MEYQAAVQAIREGNFAPVYTLLGSEKFLSDEFLDTLLAQFDDQEMLDIIRIDLNQQTIHEALDEAEMFSFFSDYRIVLINPTTFLRAKGGYKLTKDEEKRLLAYLDSPNEQTIMVFVINEDRVDKRRKLSKAMLKQTTVVDVQPLNERQVQHYLQDYLQANQIKLTKDALYELLQRVNYNLTQAMHEIAKLRPYAANGQTINLEVVEQLVARTLESDVFELTNAMMRHDLTQAVQIYQDLLLMANEPVALHALIISQFRIILQSLLLSQRGHRQQEIAKMLSVHPYRVKLALEAGSRYQLTKLRTFYLELVEADYQLKTSAGPRDLPFYLLLMKFAEL